VSVVALPLVPPFPFPFPFPTASARIVALGELGEHRDNPQQQGSTVGVKALAYDLDTPTGVEDGGTLGP